MHRQCGDRNERDAESACDEVVARRSFYAADAVSNEPFTCEVIVRRLQPGFCGPDPRRLINGFICVSKLQNLCMFLNFTFRPIVDISRRVFSNILYVVCICTSTDVSIDDGKHERCGELDTLHSRSNAVLHVVLRNPSDD